MKAATILVLLTPLVAGWSLELKASDGRKTTMHGTKDSGCKNIAFTPALKVNHVNFNKATDWYPDPSTFELYVNKGCQGLSYRNGGGSRGITARTVRSYKVY
jgi:hypothetical protein